MSVTLLKELRSIYFDNFVEARKGKDLIDRYLEKNDAEELSYLLRHHEEEGISDSETWKRDNVDFFLQYYSAVSLAMLLNLLSRQEFDDIRSEAAYYLGNAAIKRYYEYNYPILLPEILLETSIRNEPLRFGKQNRSAKQQFSYFHQLNQSIVNDNVYDFLWFLDGGEKNDYDIDDLIEVLEDPEEYLRLINSRQNSTLKNAVIGFLEYCEFIEEFYSFIKTVRNHHHRSAYWHFHGYWFNQINEYLRQTIKTFFTGMNRMANDIEDAPNKRKGTSATKRRIKAGEVFYLKIIDEMINNNSYKNLLHHALDEYKETHPF